MWLAPSPLRAAGEVVVDGESGVRDAEGAGGGMASSNPRVKSILAAHPNQNVVVCVAGCGSKPHAVQVLPTMVNGRTGTFVPSAARIGNAVYGPPKPGASARMTASVRDNDVVCIAGCIGRPGKIVQRVPDLPPPAKAARKKSNKDDGGLLDILR